MAAFRWSLAKSLYHHIDAGGLRLDQYLIEVGDVLSGRFPAARKERMAVADDSCHPAELRLNGMRRWGTPGRPSTQTARAPKAYRRQLIVGVRSDNLGRPPQAKCDHHGELARRFMRYDT